MIEIKEKPEITEDNVQQYCRHSKELKTSQKSKALKLLKYNCMRYVGDFDNKHFNYLRKIKYPKAKNIFICLPLNTSSFHEVWDTEFEKMPYPKDYNKSEYIIYENSDGTFECNCQCFQSKARKGQIVKGGANCSHILCLYFYFKMKKKFGGLYG